MLTKCIFLITLVISAARSQSLGDACIRDYDNARGVCVIHRECRRVRDEYVNMGIKITYCSYTSGSPSVVCCPGENSNNDNRPRPSGQRISEKKCQEYAELTYDRFNVWGLLLSEERDNAQSIAVPKCNPTTPLIVGGKPAGKGEFPHMAAIGWVDNYSEFSCNCGGSLISDKHILTAAHCEKSNNRAPSFVRLGDQNVHSKDDGLNEVDIDIAQFKKHPQYSSRTSKNDIAVIQLVRSVTFTQYIRPACLWQSINVNVSKVVATGWGTTGFATEQSDELLKVELDVIKHDQCNPLLREKLSLDNEKLVDNSQLCAGVLRGGRDTCGGDSGGPLQVTLPNNQCLYHIVAITSFGAVFCGFPQTPAVYTRVSAYLDFIEDQVWK